MRTAAKQRKVTAVKPLRRYTLLLDLFNDDFDTAYLPNHVVENEFVFRRLIVDVQDVKLFSNTHIHQ